MENEQVYCLCVWIEVEEEMKMDKLGKKKWYFRRVKSSQTTILLMYCASAVPRNDKVDFEGLCHGILELNIKFLSFPLTFSFLQVSSFATHELPNRITNRRQNRKRSRFFFGIYISP